MRKIISFIALCFVLITIVLASGSCTKKVTDTAAAAAENLTVVVGSVSPAGDTTIYLQTVVRPH